MTRKNEAKEPKKQSRKQYLAKRDARIEELFLREGLEPRDIAVMMLAEETLTSESEDSAIRTVRGVVAKIRKRIDDARTGDAKVEVASNEIDALERKLSRLRADHTWQLGISEDETIITTTVVTTNGEIVVEKPKWPAGVRQRARRDAAALAEKISELECVISSKRNFEMDGDAQREQGGLVIIESDKSISELIKANLIVGSFGKKGGSGGNSGSVASA